MNKIIKKNIEMLKTFISILDDLNKTRGEIKFLEEERIYYENELELRLKLNKYYQNYTYKLSNKEIKILSKKDSNLPIYNLILKRKKNIIRETEKLKIIEFKKKYEVFNTRIIGCEDDFKVTINRIQTKIQELLKYEKKQVKILNKLSASVPKKYLRLEMLNKFVEYLESEEAKSIKQCIEIYENHYF